MVTLTIDDKQISVDKDATIYDAAKAIGINIPILCHDKKLKPFGACRMCLVEVEQMKGRLIPACTTPVTEGMIVRSSTPDVIKARKLVLELLLLNHPLDCPVCDKGGDCELQNLTYDYKVNSNRLEDEKFQFEIDYNNPLIERDQNRCVLCGKCVRICDEIVSRGALTFISRGIETKIGTEFDGPLSCEFCGSCISVCPVGALLARPFKFKSRFWALKNRKSVCGYCGTGCNVTFGIKDNKSIVTTIYDEDQGFHNGQLCVRGRFGYQFISSDKRLKVPLIKKDGQLVEASWDEALTLLAEKMKIAGSASAALATARLTNEELTLLKKFMKEQLGSENIDHSAGYGHTAVSEGLFKSLGVAASSATILDIQKSDLILMIKTDCYETHPVVGFEVNMAVKNKGVKLNIVSDKRGKVSRLPGANLLINKPGTDIQILNALAKVLIDEKLAITAPSEELSKYLQSYTPEKVAADSGVAADHIRELARAYAAAEKAVIMFTAGLAYPGTNEDLAHAAANLAILADKLEKDGNGILALQEKNNSQGAVDVGFTPGAGGLDAQKILDGAASGNIKALLVAGENPVVSYRNQSKVVKALQSIEFLAVVDLFLTETAAMADLVLPACSYAEKEGTFTSTDRRVQKITPLIPVVGQARSDFDIISELISRLGGQAPESVESVFNGIDCYKTINYSELAEGGEFVKSVLKPVFVIPKVSKIAEEPGKFTLITGAALYHCGTMSLYGEGPVSVCNEPYVEISRADAAKQEITDGDKVSVKSDIGTVSLVARISPRMSEGVLFAPYHFAETPISSICSDESITFVTLSK